MTDDLIERLRAPQAPSPEGVLRSAVILPQRQVHDLVPQRASHRVVNPLRRQGVDNGGSVQSP